MNSNTTQALTNANAVSSSGTFFVKAVGANGCITVMPVTAIVNPLPQVTVQARDSLCIGLNTEIRINITGQAPYSFTYSDGTQSYTINNVSTMPYLLKVEPKQTTTYTVTSVSNRYCINRDPKSNKVTINVTYPIPPVRLNSVNTTAFTATPLKGRNFGSTYTYDWTPPVGLNTTSVPNPVFNYNKQTEYRIKMISSAGCVTVDTMTVRIVNSTDPSLTCDFYVPNAFTPNGDGKNDLMFPYTINIKQIVFFRIFNRWGELVYETSSFGGGWNGMYKGKEAIADAYTWTAEAICEDGSKVKRAGNLILIR